MKYRLLQTFSLLLLMTLIACEDPREMITPVHRTRVPQAISVTAIQDTTPSGKYRVSLSWGVTLPDDNLRAFDIYRQVPIEGYSFGFVNSTSQRSYVDTSYAILTRDSLLVRYAIFGIGKDRYIGKSSDTIGIYIHKKK